MIQQTRDWTWSDILVIESRRFSTILPPPKQPSQLWKAYARSGAPPAKPAGTPLFLLSLSMKC